MYLLQLHFKTKWIYLLTLPNNVIFFDRGGNDIVKIAKMLNTADGTDEDNLISYGMISSTYTAE